MSLPGVDRRAPGRTHADAGNGIESRTRMCAHFCVPSGAHRGATKWGAGRSGRSPRGPQAASWGEPSPGCGPPQRVQGDGGRSPVAPGPRSGAGNPGCAAGVSRGPRRARSAWLGGERSRLASGGRTPERELSATRRSPGCQRHKVPWRDRSSARPSVQRGQRKPVRSGR